MEGKFAFPHQPTNAWAWCSFIIDTGAERSVLVPVDADRMGLDRTKLVNRASSLGIGGNAPGHNEFAMVVLGDDEKGELYEFRIEAFIPESSDDMREIDGSVLGRDVLDHVQLVYARFKNEVTLDVQHADATFKVAKGLFASTAPNNVLR